jgi:hypothetical protein
MRVLAVGDSYMPARFFEDGVVTDIWPVNPRGAGPPAFD